MPWLLRANAVIGAFALLTFAGFVARVVGPRAAPFATAGAGAGLPRDARVPVPVQRAVDPADGLRWAVPALGRGPAGRADVSSGRRRRRSCSGSRPPSASTPWPTCCRWPGVIVVYAVASAATRRCRSWWRSRPSVSAVGVADGLRLHCAYVHDTRHQLRPVGLGLRRARCRHRRRRPGRAATGRLADPGIVAQCTDATAGNPCCCGDPACWRCSATSSDPAAQHPHSPARDLTAEEVGRLQALPHLTVDPHRTYAEQSMHWMGWWVGVPAILLAVDRRRADRAPLAVRRATPTCCRSSVSGLCVALLVFWRPSITPDHPWADRRFVPIVLPVLVLLATWLAGPAGGDGLPTSRRCGARPGVLVPTVLVDDRPLADPVPRPGSWLPLNALCARIPAERRCCSSTPIWPTAGRRPCATSAVCPPATSQTGSQVAVADVQAAVRAHGRSLVLLGATAAELAGRDPQHTVALTYPVDERTLTTRAERARTPSAADVWVRSASGWLRPAGRARSRPTPSCPRLWLRRPTGWTAMSTRNRPRPLSSRALACRGRTGRCEQSLTSARTPPGRPGQRGQPDRDRPSPRAARRWRPAR